MITDSGPKAHSPLKEFAGNILAAPLLRDRLRTRVVQAQDFVPSPRERVIILVGMMLGAAVLSTGLVVSALPHPGAEKVIPPLGIASGGTLECSAPIAPETSALEGDIVCSHPAGDTTDDGKLIADGDPRLVVVSQTITPGEARFEVAAVGAPREVPSD